MIGSITAVAGAFGVAWWLLRPKKAKKKKNEPPTDPSGWTDPIWVPVSPDDKKTVIDVICRLGVAPTVDRTLLAGQVWAEIWPGVPWPTSAGDHPSVHEAESSLNGLLDEWSKNPGMFCDGKIELIEDPGNWPTPGLAYQVVSGDFLGGTNSSHSIAYRALLAGGYLAGISRGLSPAAAKALAAKVAVNQGNRTAYIMLIEDSPFNLMLYGTNGYKEGVAMPGPSGLALRLLPMHASVRALFKAGTPAPRLISMVPPQDRGKGGGTGSGKHLEYLWLPKLDLAALATGTTPDTTIVPIADGMNPPAKWMDMIDMATVPSLKWGSGPWAILT